MQATALIHAVWRYCCFSLSRREVELILPQRGIAVSYGDKWHLDAVFIRIRGPRHDL